MKKKIGVAILAAGEGKRLKCDEPKALLPLLGRKMIDFPLGSSFQFIKSIDVEAICGIVIGHKKELVSAYLSKKYDQQQYDLQFAVQARPLGTADALKAYFEQVKGSKET